MAQPYFRQTRLDLHTWLFESYDLVFKHYHSVIVKDPVQPVAVGFQYIPGPDLLAIGFTDGDGKALSHTMIPMSELGGNSGYLR